MFQKRWKCFCTLITVLFAEQKANITILEYSERKYQSTYIPTHSHANPTNTNTSRSNKSDKDTKWERERQRLVFVFIYLLFVLEFACFNSLGMTLDGNILVFQCSLHFTKVKIKIELVPSILYIEIKIKWFENQSKGFFRAVFFVGFCFLVDWNYHHLSFCAGERLKDIATKNGTFIDVIDDQWIMHFVKSGFHVLATLKGINHWLFYEDTFSAIIRQQIFIHVFLLEFDWFHFFSFFDKILQICSVNVLFWFKIMKFPMIYCGFCNLLVWQTWRVYYSFSIKITCKVARFLLPTLLRQTQAIKSAWSISIYLRAADI